MAGTGKGFGNYLMVLGVIDTVALFTVIFYDGDSGEFGAKILTAAGR